jgi:hypothetical protein
MSHPFDEPLKFRKHLTNDGRVIYSNIEKRCFSNGKLTCLEYHPIWRGGLTTKHEADTIGTITKVSKPKIEANVFQPETEPMVKVEHE